jgi:hypothetical protein
MIGRAFRDDRRNGAVALALALALVALQFQEQLTDRPWAHRQGGTHLAVALGVAVGLWWLATSTRSASACAPSRRGGSGGSRRR